MTSAFSKSAAKVLALLLPLTLASLTGCGIGVQETSASADSQPVQSRAILGHVHGGVFPIRNATINLMRTQTGTYTTTVGGKTTTATSTYGSLAVSLGKTTSDNNGDFTFDATDDYTCPSGEFVYIVVTGGLSANVATSSITPQKNPNNNVVQVAALGSCSFMAAEYNTLEVYVSELSTVAAAYAMGNFMTVNDTTPGSQIVNIGAPANNNVKTGSCSGTGTAMTCTAAGLSHGFQNAENLVNAVSTNDVIPTGMANLVSPGNANVGVPQAMINTIADILQNCVDSLSTDSYCSTLFSDATLNGTAPKNTLEVALQMAQYPMQSTTTISTLYKLMTRTAYFTPYLDAAPPSFTVALSYQKDANAGPITYPVDIALDEQDNAYILYGSAAPSTATATGVTVFDATGVALGEQTNSSYGFPTQIAIDSSQNFYTTNNSATAGEVLRGSYSGALAKSGLITAAALNYASGIAVDNHNDVWVTQASTAAHSISEFFPGTISGATKNSATYDFRSQATGYAVTGVAIDPDQDIWGISSPTTGNSTIVYLNNAGGSGGGDIDVPSYSTTALDSTLASNAAFTIAPAVGNTSTDSVYIPLNGQLEYNTVASGNNGLALTPGATATVSAAKVPSRGVVDGAGDVWWADSEAAGQVYDYVPTSTPTTKAGTYGSFVPCFPIPDGSEYTCYASTKNFLTGTSIDSAGNLWVASSQGGIVFEVLGVAAPSWPLLSYTHPGSEPQ